MRHLFSLLLLFAVITLTSRSQAADPGPARPAVSKQLVRVAIIIFRSEPETERGWTAAGIIVRFAQENSEVNVVISSSNLPWVVEEPAPNHRVTLVIAYLAGSITSQLDRRVMQDDPLAGVEQVLETYQKLKTRDSEFSVRDLEKLIEIKEQGKLKEEMEARRTAPRNP